MRRPCIAATDESGSRPDRSPAAKMWGTLVRQSSSTGDVADGVHLHARRVEPQALAVRDRPDGEQRVAAVGDPAVVAAHGDLVAVLVHADGPRALEQLHPAPEQLVLEGGRHLGVLLGEDLLARDDQRHRAAERREHVDELDAGDAGADHDEVLGPDLGRVGLTGREDALAVDGGPLRDAGAAAGGEEDRVGVEPDVTVGGRHHHLVRAGEPARAAEQLHALALEELGGLRLEAVLDRRDARSQHRGVDRRPCAGVSPISGVRPTAASAPPVAIMAFDGMQSHRWAAPPITSCSTRLTLAPSRAAWVAAVLPAGPPPRITRRLGTGRGYRGGSRSSIRTPSSSALTSGTRAARSRWLPSTA